MKFNQKLVGEDIVSLLTVNWQMLANQPPESKLSNTFGNCSIVECTFLTPRSYTALQTIIVD